MAAIEESSKETQKKRPIKRATIDKWKRKKWYKIIAPAEFDKKELGETIVEKPKNLLNRVVVSNLGDLSGQRQKRHIAVRFKVTSVEGLQAHTEVVGHEIGNSFIMRMTGRRTSKMAVVKQIETADKKKMVVKVVALSARRLAAKQETAIRNEIAETIEKSLAKRDYSQLMQEIIFGSTSAKLFKQIKKIAPIKRLEVTKTELIA